MEKRRFMKRNEGYSLVEMIIVIAIIAIMTGAAMVTISIINNAKAKEAAFTLEDALSEMQQNAKGKMCVAPDSSTDTTSKQQPDYRYAVAVYKSGSKYYVKKGYYIGSSKAAAGGMDNNSNYIFLDSENGNSGKGTSLSAYVRVTYTESGGTEREISGLSGDPVYIVYDRQGMCIHGSGEFNFYRNNRKNTAINTVVLNKNGSHTSN